MILFRHIKIQNFLSFEDIEFNLSEFSTNLIVGKNGCGKSVLLDAISFVLYGKPFRNINKPELKRWGSSNKDACLVDIEFQIVNTNYKVIRGLKPNRFEIYKNGQLLDEDSKTIEYQKVLTENILKMDYSVFTQIMLLGKANYKPFLQLPNPIRSEIIEDLLGLNIFSELYKLTTDEILECKNDISTYKNKISFIQIGNKYRLNSIKVLKESLKKLNKENILKKNKNQLGLLEAQYDKTFSELQKFKQLENDGLSVKKDLKSSLYVKGKLVKSIQKYNKQVEFYKSPTCHTCHQQITEEFRNEKLEMYNTDIQECEVRLDLIDKKIEEYNEQLVNFDFIVNEVNKLNKNLNQIKQKIDIIKREQEWNDKDNDNEEFIKNEIKTNESRIIEEKSKIKEFRVEVEILKDELRILELTLALVSKKSPLKDIIIGQYLPIFNSKINTFLQKMGVDVTFEFNSSFIPYLNTEVKKNIKYNSFSEGQKLRIDLALLLAWREMMLLKSGQITNLLILDEVFDSSLDQDGVDSFMKIIKAFDSVNVFVISHTPDKLKNEFENIMKISIDNGNSIIM